ncbi:hypothetical protein [Bacteriovorax sp. DB6_IX]|uniref:hypothetical protein n=1 Tax=Bacteriovorax sp. DB6_IX TaxID=1353530 RepID=UPI0012FBC080|nr:hypothetical protein [Bacteriovorax sp. DB6_IX]
MSRMLLQRLSKSKIWLIGLSSVALFSVGHMFKDLSGKYRRVGEIRNGLQICSARTNQTFTASVIGDTSSIYMDSNFTSATEECFAEASSLIEDYKGASETISKKMNVLSSSVHWFHEALRSSGKGFSVKDNSNSSEIGTKFQVVEENTDSTLELIDSHVDGLNQSLSNLKLALSLIGLVLITSGGWEFVDRRKFQLAKKEVEDEALAELVSDDVSTAMKVEEIIVNALDLNEMTHCSKLITTYRQNVLKSMEQSEISQATPMAMVSGLNEEQIEETANKIWEESEVMDEAIATTELEPLTSKVVDHLANKLIAEGIIVDMNMDDSTVRGESETLEQVIYYVILDALMNTNKADEKRIAVKGKTLGSVYSLEISSHGEGRDTAENTSVSIAKELLSEVSGRMELANLYGEDKDVIGRKIRVIMKTATAQVQDIAEETASAGKTLVRLEKGTKKELMERLSV